jgi:protein subunit release factor A
MTDSEYKIELIYRGTGTTKRPEGQHAGSPPTEVRITHIPTGIVAQVGEHRSQHKNKALAMEMIEWALASIGFKSAPPAG